MRAVMRVDIAPSTTIFENVELDPFGGDHVTVGGVAIT